MSGFLVVRRRYLKRVRTMLRPYFSPHQREFAHAVAQRCARTIDASIATIVGWVLKVFPDGVSVDLREKLTLQRPLDYTDGRINLRVTSRTEKDVRLRSCQKEPETVEWIQNTVKAGDVFYDIGANVGAYSLIAAHWTQGQAVVYAFEPGYSTFPNLVDNIFINKCEGSVIPFQVALAAETAVRGFRYGTVEAGGATHGGITGARGGDNHRTQPLVCFRLDEFVSLFRLRPPTHLKIDVDGSELEILRGARTILDSPSVEWVLVEVDVTSTQAALLRGLLEECGFSLEGDHEHHGGVTHNLIFRRTPSRAAAEAGQLGAPAQAGSRPGDSDAPGTVASSPSRNTR